MGNTAKRRRLREGVTRPGPQQRFREIEELEVERERQRQLIAAAACERKRRQRLRDRERLAAADALVLDSVEEIDGELDEIETPSLTVRESNRVALRICELIVKELGGCPNLEGRRGVMERVFGNAMLVPLLPECYYPPAEAKDRDAFIESFKHELGLVKVANSNNYLARKSALLDAAVSNGGFRDVSALSRVLGLTSTRSVASAYKRRVQGVDGVLPGVPKLRLSRQKREGFSEYVKDCVLSWWTTQTKVSPNKKDIVRHRVGRNDWLPPHPTHYLCETQVLRLIPEFVL